MDDQSTLIRLSDSDERIAARDQDIRGRTVKDRHGEDIGTVDDLLIDPDEGRVRFLIVASGGFLGMGKEKAFIPVDAVTSVGDEVRVDQTREHLSGAPAYDPDIVPDRRALEGMYGYYGYAPYWTAGYVYPAFPFP